LSARAAKQKMSAVFGWDVSVGLRVL
jgi:hypothetical protein